MLKLFHAPRLYLQHPGYTYSSGLKNANLWVTVLWTTAQFLQWQVYRAPGLQFINYLIVCFYCGSPCTWRASISWGSFKRSVSYPDQKGCGTLHFWVHNDIRHYCFVCPSAAMCEMIKIMQEYGEVTCCLGSSANLRNSCLFLQSDIRWGRVYS